MKEDVSVVRHLIVVPAYGRDYQTEAEAISHWEQGLDFKISDVSSRYDNCYVNVGDKQTILDCNYGGVKIRYNGKADFVFVTF